jgi:hypothetical protein
MMHHSGFLKSYVPFSTGFSGNIIWWIIQNRQEKDTSGKSNLNVIVTCREARWRS